MVYNYYYDLLPQEIRELITDWVARDQMTTFIVNMNQYALSRALVKITPTRVISTYFYNDRYTRFGYKNPEFENMLVDVNNWRPVVNTFKKERVKPDGTIWVEDVLSHYVCLALPQKVSDVFRSLHSAISVDSSRLVDNRLEVIVTPMTFVRLQKNLDQSLRITFKLSCVKTSHNTVMTPGIAVYVRNHISYRAVCVELLPGSIGDITKMPVELTGCEILDD